jgi:hypothetical protein
LERKFLLEKCCSLGDNGNRKGLRIRKTPVLLIVKSPKTESLSIMGIHLMVENPERFARSLH